LSLFSRLFSPILLISPSIIFHIYCLNVHVES
jgi:hypothetical protein